MATAPTAIERDQLAAIPASYFSAVDSYDLPAVLEHFAADATLTVQTAGVTFTGHDEIGTMFTGFFADWDSMTHEITNLVVDPAASKVFDRAARGPQPHRHDEDAQLHLLRRERGGKFSRVIIWMDGTNR